MSPEKPLPAEDNPRVRKTIELAEAWERRANSIRTEEERRYQRMMRRMLEREADKTLLVDLIDQSFRSTNPRRVVGQFRYLLKHYGIPGFFPDLDQWMLRAFMYIGHLIPELSHSQILRKIRNDTRRTILPEEAEGLETHLRKRQAEGVEVNLNHLGEAVLGDGEAQNRLRHYGESLRNPHIQTISIKISNIVSQLHPLGFESELSLICERLSELYRIALQPQHSSEAGDGKPKFVNLDMEAYHDLEITLQAFMRTLDQPEFLKLRAGIVLQAYLPDSVQGQQELVRWAQGRIKGGGSAVKLRLVKGANQAMEEVESEIQGWPLPIYDSKIETDANFKRMLEFGMIPENLEAVHLGVASHNLFDLAYAQTIAEENGIREGVVFEVLEGMADPLRRTLHEKGDTPSSSLLLYTPVAAQDQFISAIAYLIRRLDENTGPDNFLRHSFDIKVGSAEWRFLKQQFLESLKLKDTISTHPRRRQDRASETFPDTCGTYNGLVFRNEPDTDWVLPNNRKWAEQIRKKWQPSAETATRNIPLVIGNSPVKAKRKQLVFHDPSQPGSAPVYSLSLATRRDVERAVKIAREDPANWRRTSLTERHELLGAAACNLRKRRGDLIGSAAAVCGKTFYESDPEISEAIDFVEYYPYSLRQIEQQTSLKLYPLGVVLVIPPWNFPIAIPTGGVSAALAAGNTVLIKPSPLAFPVAWEVLKSFWDAGIPREALQLVTCEEGDSVKTLAAHKDVDAIVFTGGTKTALTILEQRPDAEISAETGGKNATIVTAMADRDEAVGNILHSAFSHSGQKCSATSLLILEREVYEDMSFRKQLLDAIETMKVGSVWDFANKMGPLIREPPEEYRKGMETLEPGESWALSPRNNKDNPLLYHPAVKWGVKPGSFSHQTEFFGPLLSVMKAKSLEEAITIANGTRYGLTSGLESLDRREQKKWTENIEAGNLYINRVTTGAVVLRQPFGGMKLSAIGSGIKAGGPNYAQQFCRIEENGPPTQGVLREESPLLLVARHWQEQLDRGEHIQHHAALQRVVQAIYSLLFQKEREFSGEHDFFRLRGQDNLIRYLPAGTVSVRLHPDDSLFDVCVRIAAARIAGCKVQVSIPEDMDNGQTAFLESPDGLKLCKNITFQRESDEELARKLTHIDRLRYAHPERVPDLLHREAAKLGMHISRQIPLSEGRIELSRYIREQSVSVNYHRYGNLGERESIPNS